MSELPFYSWPEPTSLASATDPNQTVKLHCLCTQCQYVVGDFHRMIYDPHHNIPYKSGIPDYTTECKHYRSTVELTASSEKGCHLCSILWARLQAEMSILESLRLLESHLQASLKQMSDTVPHSYALRTAKSYSGVDDGGLILYYPPKTHHSGESENPCCHLKSCPMNKDSTDIALIEMHTIPSVYILLQIVELLIADFHLAEDFPQDEDSATVSTASDSSYSLASAWLRDCLANHKLCNRIANADFAPPTRVIDLGLQEEKLLPRLHLSSSEDLNMKYIALSHCWGMTKPAILKKNMLRTMIRGIDWSRLPKTFQDAMVITRRLGFRYLWIDSLCIMQDSLEDWSKESGNMQNVYVNCVLTIAASWGRDGGTGLFVERKPLNQQPCRIFRNACSGSYIQPNMTDVSKAAKRHNTESLEERAWAVQERFLPARLLSYRSFELQWNCLEIHGSESWPTGLRRRAKLLEAEGFRIHLQYGPKNTAFRDISKLSARSGRLDLSYMEDFYSHWEDILQTYTQAQLTYQSDIVVAISGILKSIEKWTGLTNVFGVWKELLPIDLLWVCMDPTAQATRSLLCPSWSWASLVGTKKAMFTTSTMFRLVSKDAAGESDPALIKARVLSLEQPSAASKRPMKMEIQGPILRSKVHWSGKYRPSLEGIGESFCVMDSPDDHMSDETVSCLLILERNKGDGITPITMHRLGLVLACSKEEKEAYVRIGVWSQVLETRHTTERKEEVLALNADETTISLI